MRDLVRAREAATDGLQLKRQGAFVPAAWRPALQVVIGHWNLDRVDAFLEDDPLRCMLERLPGEPTPKLPAALSRRYRAHSRSWAFLAISRTGFGRPSIRARRVSLTRAG
jgi:hypothetical protein